MHIKNWYKFIFVAALVVHAPHAHAVRVQGFERYQQALLTIVGPGYVMARACIQGWATKQGVTNLVLVAGVCAFVNATTPLYLYDGLNSYYKPSYHNGIGFRMLFFNRS